MISDKLQNFFGNEMKRIIKDSDSFETEHDKVKENVEKHKKQMAERRKKSRIKLT